MLSWTDYTLASLLIEFLILKRNDRTSLVAQWLRIRLPKAIILQ